MFCFSSVEINIMELSQQQKTQRTITEQDQLLKAQDNLISLLKEEIRQLHIQSASSTGISTELMKSAAQIQILKTELFKTRQNNDSLMLTFAAYKKLMEETQRNMDRTNSEKSAKGQNREAVDLGMFQNLRARMQQNEDTDDIVLRKAPASPLLPARSPYSQCFVHEFQNSSSSRYWQTQIFSLHTSTKLSAKLLTKLRNCASKRHFPQRLRHIFWSWLIENSLVLNEKLFDLTLQKIRSHPKMNIISIDLKRLDVKVQDEEQKRKMLVDIEDCLYVFVQMRPDIGYVQGMPYFLWMLMVRMQKYEAFRCFCTIILKDRLLSNMMTFNQAKITSVFEFFQQNLKQKRPIAYRFLEKQHITPDIYLVEWIYTFYSRAFHLSLASKIWDMWICEGSSVFFKTALAIIELLEPTLVTLEYQDSIILLKNKTQTLNEDTLMKSIQRQKLIRQEEALYYY